MLKTDQEYLINEFYESNTVTGIFLQDAENMSSFSRFQEEVLLDATQKTNKQEMPLYGLNHTIKRHLMMCIDGNAESQLD